MARFILSWPNIQSGMRHFAELPVIILVILNQLNFVNSLDISVSQVGPEADFHEVSSRQLHVDEGDFFLFKCLSHSALTAPWCGQSRLRLAIILI